MDGAIAFSAGIFLVKQISVHMLTVRERVKHGRSSNPKGEENLIVKMFKPLLGLGPSLGGQEFIDVTERVAKNNAENEPFFIMFYLAASASGALPSSADTFLKVFTYGRVIHNITMLSNMPTLRSSLFLCCASSMYYVGVSLLTKK